MKKRNTRKEMTVKIKTSITLVRDGDRKLIINKNYME